MKLLTELGVNIFGRKEVILHELEADHLIVVLGNKGRGFVPIKMLLPHQLYEPEVRRLIEDEGFDEVWVGPVGPPVQVARR